MQSLSQLLYGSVADLVLSDGLMSCRIWRVLAALIAELLVQGLTGSALEDAMREYDQTHVPEFVTRFEEPVTQEAFKNVDEPQKNKKKRRVSLSFSSERRLPPVNADGLRRHELPRKTKVPPVTSPIPWYLSCQPLPPRQRTSRKNRCTICLLVATRTPVTRVIP